MSFKEVPQLSYINLHIIRSLYGISIDQTSHVQDTIFEKWFPYAFEKVNSDLTTFKSYRTFEINPSETLTSTPADLHIQEERYLVKLSAHIRKTLHTMQYNCPDLMYAVNCLS